MKDSPKEGSVIFWFLLLVVGSVFLALCPTAWDFNGRLAKQVRCMNNLRQIAVATEAYRVDHSNGWPLSLLDLTNHLRNPEVFRCASTGREPGSLGNVPEWTDYILCSPPGENEVLAYCAPEHHRNRGGSIVFADGSAQFLKPEEFRAVLRNGRQEAPTEGSRTTSGSAPSAAPEAPEP